MSAAYDIAKKLEALGFGAVGSVIGVDAFMDKGDNEIAVFQFAGLPDVVTHGGQTQIEYPALQIQVRNISNQQAFDSCYSIYKALRGLKGETLQGTSYDYLEAKVLPQKLSVDEKQRTIWYCEIQAHRSPSA